MIRMIDTKEFEKYPTVLLPEVPGSMDTSTVRFRPGPQLSGNLQVDPEIHLPSPGMDVDIAYYYNGSATNNGPLGYANTLSTNRTAQASGNPTIVTLTRDNGALVSYQYNGTNAYIPKTPGVLNTLVKDTTNSYWKESTPDGITTAYPLDTSGHITSVSWIQDPVGNTHTFTYSSGLLQTLMDAVGRVVSFNYSGSLLSSIEDWAGRFMTFQYDTASATPKNLLTTVTGPTGCQTQYQYTTFTLRDTVVYNLYSDWLMSGIVDPNGYGTSYTFDQQRRVVNRTTAVTGATTYLYQPGKMWTVDSLGNLATQSLGDYYSVVAEVDASMGITTYTRNANLQETKRQNPLGAIWTTGYDAKGNINLYVDPLGYTTTLSFDSYNNLTSFQAADGAIWTHLWGYAGSTFDTTGVKRRLQAQIDPLGFITSYSFNSLGQVTTVQSPLGFRTSYGYDGFGNQITIQDALGNAWTSAFDLAGNVIATTNPLGATWSTTFDNENRPLTQQDPLGNISTTGYDSVGNPVVVINPLGFRTSWTYNVFDKPVAMVDALGNVSSIVFDKLGQPIASIDALGNRSTLVFDGAGRLVANVDPLGNASTAIYDIAGRPIASIDPLGNVNTTVFDRADRAIAQVDPLGNFSTIILDNLNRRVANQNALGYLNTTMFDLAGRPIASVDPLGSRYSTVFDPMGRPVATVDPLGRISTFVFDQASRVISSVDALGFRSTTNFDAAGRAISRQDALNRLSTMVFDAVNRPIAWIDALNNQSTINYDTAGRVISSVDPLNRISTTVFDALNRFIAFVSPLSYHTTINFDAAGRTISWQDALGRLSTTVFDAASRQIASVSPLGYRASTVYDRASRPVARQDALGFFWTSVFDADDRVLARVDPLGNRSTNVFDAIGQAVGQVGALGNRLSSVFDPAGRTLAQVDARSYRISFVFDVAGQQIALVAANGGISTNLYDQRGMIYASQDPLGAFTSYQFDAVGNTVLRTDARNLVTSYTLDALDRTVSVLYGDGTRVTNTFDAVGEPITQQDVTGITSFSFDLDGRQISVVDPAGNALTYSLDAVGNRVLLTDPDAGLTTYSWDSQNRLVGIINPFAELTTIQYDNLDREQHRVLGNGLHVSHTFDAARRETVLSNFSSTGTALAVFTNTYDAVSNRLSVLELDGSLVTYLYDASYQLVNEQRSGTTPYNTTFVYDGMGNRLVQNDTGVLTTNTFNAANELLTSQITVSSTFYQIDSGGSASSPFIADAYYSSASTMSTATTGSAISTTGVTNPAPQVCYQSMRLLANNSTTPLFYILPDLTPGAVYKIRLHWATFSDGSAGQRSINVLINGAPVLSHLDVFAAAGGDLKAIVREVSGTADGAGNLVVAVTADTGFPIVSAFFNALEVLGGASTEVTSYVYDPNGNLLNITDWTGATTCTWDSENRLLRVANGLNGIETYTYAADGRRRQKVTSAQTSNMIWDGQNVLQERSVANVRQTQYTDYPGAWGGLASKRQGSTTSFYGFDSQRSARILVSINGTITDSYAYKTFGEELAQGTAPNTLYTDNPYRYVGEYGYYRDTISRLSVRARHLNANIGRWISRDPIGFLGGDWNMYCYVQNHPTSLWDPSGLKPPKPGTPAQCGTLLNVIIGILDGILDKENENKGLITRCKDLANDVHKLYEYHYKLSNAHDDYGSYEGHEHAADKKLAELQRKLKEWDDKHCNNHFPGNKDIKRAEATEAKKVPTKPDRHLRPEERYIPETKDNRDKFWEYKFRQSVEFNRRYYTATTNNPSKFTPLDQLDRPGCLPDDNCSNGFPDNSAWGALGGALGIAGIIGWLTQDLPEVVRELAPVLYIPPGR